MKSILSITSFMVHTFDVISKLLLPCPSPRSSRFSSVLFFGSFIVWHFTLRSIIHFELIFVKDMKSVCWLFFFFFPWHVDVSSSTICWKHYLCSIALPLLLYHRSVDHMFLSVCISGFLFCSIDLFLSPIPDYLDCCRFMVSLEIS